jgi:ketosteroid isomerase-like protein
MLLSASLLVAFAATRTQTDDARVVAALDTRFQAATKANDAAGIDSILADDYVLVLGDGRTFSKVDLVNEARAKSTVYEHQEDTKQTVHVWGNTAVVTALLWGKGTRGGKTFDKHLWFSDTYVRTPSGWRYVFGQASLPIER